ncbi:penicillin acylase family protein, partial [Pseudomonas sp. BGM005]|nr:penicillin acylase family protein [Pseudomonas sp. BG5]
GSEYALSLRWTALDPGTSATAIFALSTAQDFDDFRRAASLFDVPAQNLIYADVEGNIGYQAPGRLPVRGAGDGWLPQPGWDSAYDWTGFI